ncbi:hypothetical protein LAZ67_12000120 [Cordylochernes scorpioides]|uniref:Peptidase A2 domain-containing protein n=1 Tax=Cordylochernes scorpioides TaxID=51811 RepID=A0ABY6L2M2_9ARAC|nr:hypothetical protein LAZ67_12000120 [Cordylochernes scorpioides]
MAKVKAELDDIQEDLKQAIDILKEQVKKSHQSGNAMFFKEAIEGISEFDGSTVPIKKWLQEIDDNGIIFAKLWLRSQPTFSTWPELKEAITNEFDNPIDSRNIHILLTKRKKQQFESYYEYFLNMRELGSQGNLEEAVIIQYVIDGIPDQEFNKSILYGSTSYSDFKIKLKKYEMIKSKSKTNSTTSKVIPKPIDDKESKCFDCGKRGHLSRHKNIDHELQALIDTGSQLNLIGIDRYLAIGSPSFDADDRFISGIGNKRVNWKLQKALNSTHQRSIRMSPFELLVGVKMRKEDLRLLEMIDVDLALTFDEERDQKRKEAKQEILKIQEENRNTFNKKIKKAFVYKEGDLVVIQKFPFATKSKLYPKYIGPYKVIKIKPNDRYNVEKFAHFEGPNRTSCSADLMKPWFSQDEYPSELSEADKVQDGRM